MNFDEIMGQEFPEGLKVEPVAVNGDEDCPEGDACAIHFRNSERYRHEGQEYGRYIDYVGDYAIITDMAPLPESTSPADMLRLLLSAAMGEKPDVQGALGDAYQTTVEKVGKGALADLPEMSMSEYEDTVIQYKQTFDDWDQFETNHLMVVQLVKDGMIDLGEK